MTQAKVYCAKVYEEVSQSWGALFEDVELHEITNKLNSAEKNMGNLRSSLKNLPPIEKMRKSAENKALQQQINTL